MRRLAFLFALLTVGATTHAQTSPAGFIDGERSLETLIEFPELRGDATVTISCFGVLEANGRMERHACYRRNAGDEVFIREIYDAVKKANFQPAMFDGRERPVAFQYRVQFAKKGDEQEIRLVANPGYEENVEAYGHDHIAAQRMYTKPEWQTACPRRAGFVVLAKANVDYDGTPSAVSIVHADGIPITQRCEQALIDDILSSPFIPAMADGESVPSTYVEPYGN